MSKMKVVCMCQGGNSRSAGCGFILKYEYGMDALACGWEGNTPETLEMLFNWAEAIIIMEAKFVSYVPDQYRSKVFVVDVGPDRWFNSLHPDLLNTIRPILARMVKPVGESGDAASNGNQPEGLRDQRGSEEELGHAGTVQSS